MTKLNRETFRQLRESLRDAPPPEATVEIIVGMGTSGIAAGAREAFEAFADELREHGVDARVGRTGSLGLDYAEPTAEVRVPGMPPVIYGKVTPEVARKIVRKHVLGRALINDHVYDRPAADIVRGEGS